ncbi:MAG: hypothetical protein ACJ8BW_26985 [Ktedonobacteraceae bacterium]
MRQPTKDLLNPLRYIVGATLAVAWPLALADMVALAGWSLAPSLALAACLSPYLDTYWIALALP